MLEMSKDDIEFEASDRIVEPAYNSSDGEVELTLRPKTLAEYIGQDKVKENMAVYIEAAKKRGECLDHVLLYGPPGLGKTTLSCIANEMGVNIRVTSGPAIEKAGDLAALLTNLQPNDVLFIDEIHRLSRQVEEVLYPAMEDYVLDIVMGNGPAARSISARCGGERNSDAYRCHYAFGAAFRAASRSIRSGAAAGALLARAALRHSAALGGNIGHSLHEGRRYGACQAFAGHSENSQQAS